MSDELHTYEQTLVTINKNHASTVSRGRYNPWQLGVYASLSLAAPIVVAAIGYQLQGQLGAGIGFVLALTFPGVVLLYVIDGVRVEHQRMLAERDLLKYGPTLPEPPATSYVGTPEPVKLVPGLIQDGKVVARAPQISQEKIWLQRACLALIRAGCERGSWSRSALAEGPNAILSGEEWDAASPALQEMGFFYVKAGRGGGLLPTPGKDLDEVIKRLEVAS